MYSNLLKKTFLLTLSCLGFGFTISAQQFVNHLNNAGFNIDKSQWEYLADNDDGAIASVIDPSGGYHGTGALHTGYVTQLTQTVDLSALGFADALLDNSPIVRFAVNVKGTGVDAGDQIRYNLELRNAAGDVIESEASDWIVTSADWQLITHNFINYGPGVRSVYVWMEAWDLEADQTTNQGVLIDAVNLSIGNHLLFTNTGATLDFAGWDNVTNGGDGWNTNGWAQTSFDWCSKGQTIDLLEMGYTADALDSEPLIQIWEFILGNDGPGDGSGFADEHQMKIELRDAAGNVMDSYDTGVMACTDAWQEIGNIFTDYGSGLRSVYIEHGGKDIEYWGGTFGGSVDATTMLMDFCQGFTLAANVVDESTPNANDGSITPNVSGGVAEYSYSWSTGETTANISGLADGEYSVTITDGFNCQQIETFTVAGGVSSVDAIAGLSAFAIAPNPTTGNVQITIALDNGMDAELQVYDLAGKMIQSFALAQFRDRTYAVDLSEQPAGLYLAKLILDNQVITKRIMKQ